MKSTRKKAYYSISAVAEMFSVHQQTIRLYEKQGLISPKRSEGNTRLFSQEDVDRLDEIIYLTHKLGINLAGVEMILKLKKQMKKMQKDMNKLFENTQDQLQQEAEKSIQTVKSSVKELVQLQQENETPATPTTSEQYTFDVDNWDIEYDDQD